MKVLLHTVAPGIGHLRTDKHRKNMQVEQALNKTKRGHIRALSSEHGLQKGLGYQYRDIVGRRLGGLPYSINQALQRDGKSESECPAIKRANTGCAAAQHQAVA